MSNLSGTWKDDENRAAKIEDNDGTLTFTPITNVWWSSASGSWKRGTSTNAGDFAGSSVFKGGSGSEDYSFCVANPANSIVFANGHTWTRQ